MSETRIDQCQICVMKCGLAVEVDPEAIRILRIRADCENAAWHDFCQLAANSARVIEHLRRLRQPLKRGGDRYVLATYEEAARDIAARRHPLLAEDPHSVGLYFGNPGGLATTVSAYACAFLGATGARNRFLVISLDLLMNVNSTPRRGTPAKENFSNFGPVGVAPQRCTTPSGRTARWAIGSGTGSGNTAMAPEAVLH